MKKTRFTDEQMVTILREADEKSVPEVAKKHGVSAQTIYGWRKHFGTLEPADVSVSGRTLGRIEEELMMSSSHCSDSFSHRSCGRTRRFALYERLKGSSIHTSERKFRFSAVISLVTFVMVWIVVGD